MKILVANIGSTSFKYRLFDMETGAVWRKAASNGSASPADLAPIIRCDRLCRET